MEFGYVFGLAVFLLMQCAVVKPLCHVHVAHKTHTVSSSTRQILKLKVATATRLPGVAHSLISMAVGALDGDWVLVNALLLVRLAPTLNA